MMCRICCLVLTVLVLGGCYQDEPVGVNGQETETTALYAAKGPAAVLPLPNGFSPEGIAIGGGPVFYVGSLADGSIYKGDVQTGAGDILVGPTGQIAVGLGLNRRGDLLFVAGGTLGIGSVYDANTGGLVNSFQLTSDPNTFINDVVVGRTAAYFTDSFRQVFYRVALSPNGQFMDPPVIDEIPLGGDFDFVPGAFNSNGIVMSASGAYLVIVSSVAEKLYRVDPMSGEALAIDLGGELLPNGDGLLLDGLNLYVVQNRLNQIAVIRMDPSLESGEITDYITDPGFRVPTTIASFGRWLYAVNARFGDPPGPTTEYEAVRVPKR